MEEIAKRIALHLSLVVEVAATVVIAIALLQLAFFYSKTVLNRDVHITNARLRIKFGSALTIALELLLAADILQTAVAPTWDDIGKLAAIATIRTALNFFLAKELKEIENRELEKRSG